VGSHRPRTHKWDVKIQEFKTQESAFCLLEYVGWNRLLTFCAGRNTVKRWRRDENVLALLRVCGVAVSHGAGSGSAEYRGDLGFRHEEYPLLLATTGERALDVGAAQLIVLAQWIRRSYGSRNVRIGSTGIRNQVATLIGADLEQDVFLS